MRPDTLRWIQFWLVVGPSWAFGLVTLLVMAIHDWKADRAHPDTPRSSSTL
jgi:hypothetical protein